MACSHALPPEASCPQRRRTGTKPTSPVPFPAWCAATASRCASRKPCCTRRHLKVRRNLPGGMLLLDGGILPHQRSGGFGHSARGWNRASIEGKSKIHHGGTETR